MALTFLQANGEYRTERFTGFVGKCTFRLKGHPSSDIIKALNTLADFAFYSGTGMKTTMGMGLTRRI